MKKIVLTIMLLSVCLLAYKGMFQSVPVKDAVILQTGKDKNDCPACGMHIPQFYKTSHAVKLKNGEYRQYCSLYCLVDEMEFEYLKDKKDQIEQILVVDTKTLKYIDVKKAFYVVGSKKPGTMSMTSEYAFEKKADAEAFQKENGGEITDYAGVYKIKLKDFGR